MKFNFLVHVGLKSGEEGKGVRLEPSEHQAFVWASEEEVRNGRCIDEDGEVEIELTFTSVAQREIILEGFELWRMMRTAEGDEQQQVEEAGQKAIDHEQKAP